MRRTHHALVVPRSLRRRPDGRRLPDGVWYGDVDGDDADRIVSSHLDRDRIVSDLVDQTL